MIALTAFSSDKLKQECFQVGMKKVLSKPITIKPLGEALQQHFYRISKAEFRSMKQNHKEKSGKIEEAS